MKTFDEEVKEARMNDGENRVCHECENTVFHRFDKGLITCSCCFAKYQPLRALDRIFRTQVI